MQNKHAKCGISKMILIWAPYIYIYTKWSICTIRVLCLWLSQEILNQPRITVLGFFMLPLSWLSLSLMEPYLFTGMGGDHTTPSSFITLLWPRLSFIIIINWMHECLRDQFHYLLHSVYCELSVSETII